MNPKIGTITAVMTNPIRPKPISAPTVFPMIKGKIMLPAPKNIANIATLKDSMENLPDFFTEYSSVKIIDVEKYSTLFF